MKNIIGLLVILIGGFWLVTVPLFVIGYHLFNFQTLAIVAIAIIAAVVGIKNEEFFEKNAKWLCLGFCLIVVIFAAWFIVTGL